MSISLSAFAPENLVSRDGFGSSVSRQVYTSLTLRQPTPMGLTPSSLWSLRIFPFFPGSRFTSFYCDSSSALLQLNQRLNFPFSRSHAFCYGKNNITFRDKNRTHDFRTSRCAGYLLLMDYLCDEGTVIPEYGYIKLYGCLYLMYCNGNCCSCYRWVVRCLLHMLG